MQKKSHCSKKTKKAIQKLDPTVKVAIINGIFLIIVALISKLL